jgi:uncharacterized linocin/CFP29 family protein
MDDLRREQAPFSAEAWAIIDDEARGVLKQRLAGRKVVDFEGPLGWNASSVDLGRTDPVPSPQPDVHAALRRTLPLVELRVPFQIDREEIRAIERGAADPDLDAVRSAAGAIATAEDQAVFYGFAGAGIVGIAEAASDNRLTLSPDYLGYPGTVVEALALLKTQAVEGPYALVLGPRCWAGLHKTTSTSGLPVIDHVRQLVGGPIIWGPAVDGALLVSLRGGDFQMTVGRDISIGYDTHDRAVVDLYLVESLTFRNLAPEAAVPLVYG